MNPKVYSYTGGKGVSDVDMPPDPGNPDLCVRREPGETVYIVTPMSEAGRTFLVDHNVDGWLERYDKWQSINVPQREIFPFMNEVFDAGVKVV